MRTIEHIFCDLDSLCYQSAYQACWEDVKICILGKLKGIRETVGLPKECLSGFIEHPDSKWNFRHHVAITRKYKDRDHSNDPQHLRDAKLFLAEHGHASMVRSMESEDAVSIQAHAYGLNRCAIAGIDKDLLQIPATFVNYNKYVDEHNKPLPRGENSAGKRMLMFNVGEHQAAYNFYTQVLTGDSTDSITGLEGIGPKSAQEILDSSDNLPLTVAQAYKERNKPYSYLMEQCRLLYILRHPQDIFQYPLTAEEYEQ